MSKIETSFIRSGQEIDRGVFEIEEREIELASYNGASKTERNERR